MKPKTNEQFPEWRPILVFTLLFSLIFVTACKEDQLPLPEKPGKENPSAGELEVTVISESDEDNFIISIEGGEEKAVGANEKVSFNLNNGKYLVELKGLGTEWEVEGDNPVLVKILPKKKTSLIFKLIKKPHCHTTDQIVFSSDRTGYREVYSMNPDGSNVRQLTNYESTDYAPWIPEISPDGTQVLFAINGSLFKMDINDGDLHQITFRPDPPLDNRDGYASWSADGSKIVFSRMIEGDESIHIMNADGTDIQEISGIGLNIIMPDISPDGSKVLYVRDWAESPEGAHIFVVNSDGTNDVTLISHGFANYDPKWSPDGTKILFRSSISEGDLNYQLYLANADGTGIVQITSDAASKHSASWSPDGTKIVYVTSDSMNIYSINADGTGRTQLTDNLFNDNDPSWGPVAAAVLP